MGRGVARFESGRSAMIKATCRRAVPVASAWLAAITHYVLGTRMGANPRPFCERSRRIGESRIGRKSRCLTAAWLLSLVMGLEANAQTPTPYPTIETGTHTASIRSIAVDRDERWLITASDDKTARVWDLVTGRLDRTLRTPIGTG